MAPDSLKLEVEFTTGVWTDVSQWVDWSAGGGTHYGRGTTYSTPQPATFNCTLDNTDGRFTPNRQTLVDGTAHPYWPNVVPRKRIRFSGVVAGTAYQRFQGYVRGWPPGMKDLRKPRVQIDAVDRLDQMSHVKMNGDIAGEILADSPFAYWKLNEPVGSTASTNSSGVTTIGLYVSGAGAAVTYGVDGPGVEQGLAVAFAQGKYMGSILNFNRAYTAFTLECWCKFTTVNQTEEAIAEIVDNNGVRHIIITGTAGPGNGIQYIETTPGSTVGVAVSPAMNDGLWHHVVIGMGSSGGVSRLYVDTVDYTLGATGWTFGSILGVRLSQDILYNSFLGSVAHVAVYDHLLTPARILAHYNVAQQSGELTSDKVKRFLAYGGLQAGDMNVDTGIAVTGTYPQAGQDIVSACNDMAVTEGSGSVFYITPDGKARFTNRNDRKPAAPALTIDMAADADGNTYGPEFDDTGVVSAVLATRATASGTATTQVASNPAIAAAYPDNMSITSYAATDSDVQDLAQQVLAANDTVQFRLQQVTVDYVNASTAGLFAAAASTLIGDRIRATSIYAAAADATQKDGIVEGWTDTFSDVSYRTTFDTSPADSPAVAVFDDTTYGRFGALGLFLSSDITNSATTIVVASTRTNLCSNGDFETNTSGWAGGGTVAPILTQSGVRGVASAHSLLITWGTAGTLPNAGTSFTAVTGKKYTVSAWVYVPTGSPGVSLSIGNGGGLSGSSGSTKDAWIQVSQTFTATASVSTNVQIWPNSTPSSGQTCYVDEVLIEQSSSVNSYINGTVGASNPMFTTVSARYPLTISIDTEVIKLGSVPGGASSPQTFTGVTRAQKGTAAAAHLAGAVVQIWPAPTFGL